MKKVALIAVLLTATAAFAGFNLGNLDLTKTVKDLGKVAHGAITGIGSKEEQTIGESVSVEIINRYGGLVRDEAITRRVNLVGKSLAAYCDRQDLNFRFGVLNSPTVNAFSAPGGTVFITKGLYDQLQNDDQLAGVLAHEITHVTKRHAISIIDRDEALSGMAGLAQDAGSATRKTDLAKYSQGVGKVTTTMFDKGFDPGKEFDADKGGAQLAATVGYAPDGLEQALKMLKQHETGKMPMFPTHPPLDKRIARLDSETKH